MTRDNKPSRDPATRAGHGYRNEVTWNDGQGRQPYANRGEQEGPPAGFEEAEGGDRGVHSGVNLEQAERAKGTP